MQHSITFSKLRLRKLSVAGCAFALFAVVACTDEAIVYPNRNLKPPAGGSTSSEAGEAGMSQSGGTSAGGSFAGGGTGGSVVSLGGGDDLIDDAGAAGTEPLDQCGDGVVQPPEECDDNNRVSGDGCSAQCQSSCETCEKKACPIWGVNNDIQDWYTACYKLEGIAATGAAALLGVPRAQLCAAAVDCVRTEHCARLVGDFVDIRSCWCDVDWGNTTPGVNAASACKAEPSDDPSKPSTFVKGKCYHEFLDASEAPTNAAVLSAFTATSKGMGAAYGLLMGCDRHVCAEECFKGVASGDAVTTIAADLTATQNAAGESQLGDMMADSFRLAAKTDFALVSSFVLAADGDNLWFKATPNRAEDADGRVLHSEALAVIDGYAAAAPTSQAVYQLGVMVTGTYSGQQIYDALGEQFHAGSSRLLVSGLKYTWSGVAGQSPEPTIVEVRTSDGTLLDKAKTYTVTTNTPLTDQTTTFPTLAKGTNISNLANGNPVALWLSYLHSAPQPIAAPTLDRVTLQPSP